MRDALDPERAAAVRIVSLDVDGVLTDGSIWLGAIDGAPKVELRRFHVHDGLAIQLLNKVGIGVALVSGHRSAVVEERARRLGVRDVALGNPEAKLSGLKSILDRRGLELGEAVHLGDDLTDLPVMAEVGLPVAVANAVPEVKAAAHWVGTVAGGHGAVREFAETLLRTRGDWDDLAAGITVERKA